MPAVVLSRPARPPAYVPTPADARPPADSRYSAALQQGIDGDRLHAGKAFLALAAETPDRNTRAWALYQAGIGAASLGDPAARERLWARLRRETPAHPLALRLASTAPSAAPDPHPEQADCGPRALAHLLTRAGKPVDLHELTKACGTDAGGTTLLALRDQARKAGLRAAALRADASFLRRERCRGIAWVDGRHYVCVEPEGEAARLWDPDGEQSRLESWERLALRSQGTFLAIAWGDAALPEVVGNRSNRSYSTYSTPPKTPHTQRNSP